MPPPVRRRRAQTPRQRAPTREGPSFAQTLQSLGRQRAAQPPQRTPTNIPGRPVQTGRTEGGFAPVQAPIGQQNQYVGPTPMEAWESNLGGSPSFAQTMGQVAQQRAQFPPITPGIRPTQEGPSFAQTMAQTPFQGSQRDAVSDARIAAGGDPSRFKGATLAKALGLDYMSPAAQQNLATNTAMATGDFTASIPPSAPSVPWVAPGKPVTYGGAKGDPIYPSVYSAIRNTETPDYIQEQYGLPADLTYPSPSYMNQNVVPMSVAPMLDVFRNNPTAMQALSGAYGGRLPGYWPQGTGLPYNIFPWEQFSPIFGSTATAGMWGSNRGGMGRGSWTGTGAPPWMTDPYGSQFGNILNQNYPGKGWSGIGGPPRRGGL